MDEESHSGSDESPFGGLWLAGVIILLLTLGVWVFFYSEYGDQGQLSLADTTVVAFIIAFVVFGARWLLQRRARKPKQSSKEVGK